MGAWLSEVVLEVEAGAEVFARGDDYAEHGLVDLVTTDDERIVATVHGTEAYRVELARSDAALQWSCTCPYAVEMGAAMGEVRGFSAAVRGTTSPTQPG